MSLELIIGGKDPQSYDKYRFIEGLVTDTRLMGVVGLFAHWELELENQPPQQIYQYYYYDAEEFGLDFLRIFNLKNSFEAQLALRSSFGCLGAKYRAVNEKECRWLVNFFIDDTKRKKVKLPKEVQSIGYITDAPEELSSFEQQMLFEKTCVSIESYYGLVNYYLMRCFAKDKEGSEYLKDKNSPDEAFEDISLPEQASFMKNSIKEYVNPDDTISYISQSLVETENDYYIIVTDVMINNGKICSAKKISQMVISLDEASLNLDSKEYVNVYEIICSEEIFDAKFRVLSLGTQTSDHDSGRLYMEYKEDNKHVENKVFRLADDVNALYYVTVYGQLITVAYSPESLRNLDDQIQAFLTDDCVCLTSSYHFENSVIYDYIQSDYMTFEEFAEEYE